MKTKRIGRAEQGGAEFGVAMFIAIVVMHGIILIFMLIHTDQIRIPPGAQVTLPAMATSPRPGVTSPPVLMAAAAVAESPVEYSTPLLIMRTGAPGRLQLIATKRGVVQRDSGNGWEFFDFVNRVPWYWDVNNDGEACVIYRLIDAD